VFWPNAIQFIEITRERWTVLTLEGDQSSAMPKFTDSPLEGDGFELSVPGRETVKPSWETGLLSRKRERICWGTEGSNPSPSSAESTTNRSRGASLRGRNRQLHLPGRGGAASDRSSSCSGSDTPNAVPRQGRHLCLRAGGPALVRRRYGGGRSSVRVENPLIKLCSGPDFTQTRAEGFLKDLQRVKQVTCSMR
jgi:hypothetical protein